MLNSRAIASWVYMLTTMSTGFIVLTVVSKYLEPTNAGLWFTMQASISFVILAEMGVGYVLMRELSHSFGKQEANPNLNNKTLETHWIGALDLKTITKLRVITVSISLLVGLIFTVYFIKIENKLDYVYTDVVWAWGFYVIASSINVALIPYKAYLESAGKLNHEKYMSSVGHIVGAILVILGAIYTNSLTMMSVGNVVGILLTFLLLRFQCRKNWGPHSTTNKLSIGVKRILSLGLGFLWINLGAVATKYSYAPIVTGIIGSAALAPIFIIVKVFGIASTGISVFVMSERAFIARYWGAKNKKKAIKHFKRLLIIISLLSFILGGAVATTSAVLLPVFFGESYNLPDIFFLILLIDLILNNISAACGHFVMATGLNPFKISVFMSGIFTVCFLLYLVPLYGILGAVLSPFIAGCLTSYWYNIFWAWRLIKDDKKLLHIG